MRIAETGTGDGGTPRRDRRWASSISRFNIAAAYRATPTAVEGVLRREGRWHSIAWCTYTILLSTTSFRVLNT